MIKCLRSSKVCHRFILHTFLYLVPSIMNNHKVPSVVIQNIIIKLSTNKNVKAIEMSHRLDVIRK